MTDRIRTWHAPDADPGLAAFRKKLAEPEPRRPQPAATATGTTAPRAGSTTPRDDRRRAHRPDPPDLLSALAGQQVIVYLLAQAGERTGPILTGRLRRVVRYELALETADGRLLVIEKHGVLMVESVRETT